MLKMDAVFTAAEDVTPEFAAKLARHVSHFQSDMYIECAGKRLSLDSLICILALEMHRGVAVTILADGVDQAEAAEEIRRVLQGEI